MNILTNYLFFFAILLISHFAHGALWTAGHGDLGIGYEDGELEPHWHLGHGNESVTLDGVSAPLGAE